MSVEGKYGQFRLGPRLSPEAKILSPEPVSLPDYIVIEGNSGAGKTTTANIIENSIAIPHIGEYGNYLNFDIGENFPNFPPMDSNEVVGSNPIWPQIEIRRRAHQIFSAQKSPETMQVVERSPISLIAFEYAKMQQGVAYDICNLPGLYSKLYEAGILKEPSGYVFIKASPESIKERVKSRRINPTQEFLCRPQTINSINEFIERFLIKYIEPSRYLMLNSDITNQEDMATEIIEFINKLKGNLEPTNGISMLAHNALNGQPLL
jgi:hypothetical protein